MLTGIHAVAALVSSGAVFAFRVSTPANGTAISIVAVILQALSFSLGVYSFTKINHDLRAGQYQGVSVPLDMQGEFGIGLYLSGGSVVVELLACFFAFIAQRRQKSPALTANI